MDNEEKRYWSEHSFIVDLIKQIPSNIFWKNKDGVYIGCNKAFANSLGFSSPKEVIGKTDYELPTTKEENDRYRADDIEVMRSRQPKLNIEESQTLADGSKIILLTSKVPLLNKGGRIMGVLGIYTDITERKKMEENLRQSNEKAEIANRAKATFITNMSHDVRTPLNGVIGMANILEKEGDSTRDREYGHIIHKTSKRLLDLLNGILEIVSANESRDDKIKYTTFNLLEQINHLYDLFLANAQIKKIKLEINAATDLPKYIVSDQIKIDRILLNLISNALKFTTKGHVKLDIKLLTQKNKKAILQFTVSDTGIGISQDKINHIFDCFYKIDSYKEKQTGYGIGLFMVKKFITLLGGEITVTSKPKQGTEFKVILPVEVGKAEDAKRQIEEINSNILKEEIVALKKSNKLNILFIEDDNVTRHTGQYVLKSAGLKVYSVSGAEKAIKAIKSQSFDLVITDIGLPNIDGNEFTYLLRRLEQKIGKKPLPVIGLTANDSLKTKSEAIDVGMNMVLTKPLNDQKVHKILNFLLRDIPHQVDEITIENNHQANTKQEALLSVTRNEIFQLEKFPLFDEQEATKNIGNNQKLKRMLKLLVNDTIPNELPNIYNAYKNSDWETIKATAHKLKGSAIYCGTVKMQYACQYLECYHLADDNKLLEELYQQFVKILIDTQNFIFNYLNSA